MAFKNNFFIKGLIVTIISWLSLEIAYQYYLHKVYVENKIYNYDRYVYERNSKIFSMLDEYFSKRSTDFAYSYHPQEGNLNTIPDSVKCAILNLKKELIGGCFDIFNLRQNFSIASSKTDSIYRVYIEAGATFNENNNGYNFSMLITNDANPSNDYVQYEKLIMDHLFVEKQEKHLSNDILLFYNSNSPDLLILKLFR
jgi:hypothetical protein